MINENLARTAEVRSEKSPPTVSDTMTSLCYKFQSRMMMVHNVPTQNSIVPTDHDQRVQQYLSGAVNKHITGCCIRRYNKHVDRAVQKFKDDLMAKRDEDQDNQVASVQKDAIYKHLTGAIDAGLQSFVSKMSGGKERYTSKAIVDEESNSSFITAQCSAVPVIHKEENTTLQVVLSCSAENISGSNRGDKNDGTHLVTSTFRGQLHKEQDHFNRAIEQQSGGEPRSRKRKHSPSSSQSSVLNMFAVSASDFSSDKQVSPIKKSPQLKRQRFSEKHSGHVVCTATNPTALSTSNGNSSDVGAIFQYLKTMSAAKLKNTSAATVQVVQPTTSGSSGSLAVPASSSNNLVHHQFQCFMQIFGQFLHGYEHKRLHNLFQQYVILTKLGDSSSMQPLPAMPESSHIVMSQNQTYISPSMEHADGLETSQICQVQSSPAIHACRPTDIPTATSINNVGTLANPLGYSSWKVCMDTIPYHGTSDSGCRRGALGVDNTQDNSHSQPSVAAREAAVSNSPVRLLVQLMQSHMGHQESDSRKALASNKSPKKMTCEDSDTNSVKTINCQHRTDINENLPLKPSSKETAATRTTANETASNSTAAADSTPNVPPNQVDKAKTSSTTSRKSVCSDKGSSIGNKKARGETKLTNTPHQSTKNTSETMATCQVQVVESKSDCVKPQQVRRDGNTVPNQAAAKSVEPKLSDCSQQSSDVTVKTRPKTGHDKGKQICAADRKLEPRDMQYTVKSKNPIASCVTNKTTTKTTNSKNDLNAHDRKVNKMGTGDRNSGVVSKKKFETENNVGNKNKDSVNSKRASGKKT